MGSHTKNYTQAEGNLKQEKEVNTLSQTFTHWAPRLTSHRTCIPW
jgi:hypothetical protein